MAIMMSPYKCKSLEWAEKPQINKQTDMDFQ